MAAAAGTNAKQITAAMIDEYREAKKVQGVTDGTLYEIALSLRNFEGLAGKCKFFL